MDFELPQDLRLMKEQVRRFVDRELIPIERETCDGPDLKPEVRARLEARRGRWAGGTWRRLSNTAAWEWG
jgi:hypothetical protein